MAKNGASAARGGRPTQRSDDRASASARLRQLRGRLDTLDAEILAKLSTRYAVVEEVQRVKVRSGDGNYVPSRERDQVARLETLNRTSSHPIRPEALRAIFGEILSASRALQAPLTVAYLGPAGTFSERAARAHFGSSAELLPQASIPEVFQAVEREQARLGIVPIENSIGGMVVPTLDSLVASPLRIVAERELAIRHALLSRAQSLASIRRVVSHPQSIAQCRDWLARHLPRAQTIEVASNSVAAQSAARGRTTGAIGARDLASRHGLRVLADNIQDLPRNVTRFVVVAQEAMAGERGADRVSVVFSVRNEAGSLFRALRPFATAGIDLHKLESRPTRGRPWEYVFFVDFRGDVDQPRVRRAMATMARHCIWLKVLGAYTATARA